MDRKHFLKELQTSFIDTVKNITFPLIEDDLEKIDRMTEKFSGYTFFPTSFSLPLHIFHEATIHGNSLIFYRTETDVHAFSATCQTCHHLLQYLAYKQTYTCFLCGKEATATAYDELLSYPTKYKNDVLHVGIPTKG